MDPYYSHPELRPPKRKRCTPPYYQNSASMDLSTSEMMPGSITSSIYPKVIPTSELFNAGYTYLPYQQTQLTQPGVVHQAQTNHIHDSSYIFKPGARPMQQPPRQDHWGGWSSQHAQTSRPPMGEHYTDNRLASLMPSGLRSSPQPRQSMALASMSFPAYKDVFRFGTTMSYKSNASRQGQNLASAVGGTCPNYIDAAPLQIPYNVTPVDEPSSHHQSAGTSLITPSPQPELTREALEQHLQGGRSMASRLNPNNLAVPGPRSTSDRRRSKGPYNCLQCHAQLKTFKEHERHHCTRFSCPFCSSTMSRKEYVVRHIKMRSCKHMTEEQREAWLAARDRGSTVGRSSTDDARHGRELSDDGRQAAPNTTPSNEAPWWTATTDSNAMIALDIGLEEDQAANTGGNGWLTAPYDLW